MSEVFRDYRLYTVFGVNRKVIYNLLYIFIDARAWCKLAKQTFIGSFERLWNQKCASPYQIDWFHWIHTHYRKQSPIGQWSLAFLTTT